MARPTKPLYYLEIAKATARRSTCKHYQCGAIIVKNDRIISTGYNGAPAGCPNCSDQGHCMLELNHIPEKQWEAICPAVDAEINAIISASRELCLYATMYVYCWDCKKRDVKQNMESSTFAKRVIINSGLNEIIYADPSGIGRSDNDGIHYGYRTLKVEALLHSYDHLLDPRMLN